MGNRDSLKLCVPYYRCCIPTPLYSIRATTGGPDPAPHISDGFVVETSKAVVDITPAPKNEELPNVAAAGAAPAQEEAKPAPPPAADAERTSEAKGQSVVGSSAERKMLGPQEIDAMEKETIVRDPAVTESFAEAETKAAVSVPRSCTDAEAVAAPPMQQTVDDPAAKEASEAQKMGDTTETTAESIIQVGVHVSPLPNEDETSNAAPANATLAQEEAKSALPKATEAEQASATKECPSAEGRLFGPQEIDAMERGCIAMGQAATASLAEGNRKEAAALLQACSNVEDVEDVAAQSMRQTGEDREATGANEVQSVGDAATTAIEDAIQAARMLPLGPRLELRQLGTGELLEILEGPVIGQEGLWANVRAEIDGLTGWAEVHNANGFLLEPLPPG